MRKLKKKIKNTKMMADIVCETLKICDSAIEQPKAYRKEEKNAAIEKAVMKQIVKIHSKPKLQVMDELFLPYPLLLFISSRKLLKKS